MAGFFIVTDGPDGTGKSTLAAALVEHLNAAGISTLGTHEPYTSRVRAWLSDRTVGPRELLIAFAHDRDLHLREVVEPALAAGFVVVCDRYTYSTLAYQTLHNPPEVVEALVSHVRKPDLTLLLSCPVETAMARIVARGLPPDRYDQRADLQARVSAAYASYGGKDPAAVHIDASGAPEAVLEAALGVVLARLRDSGATMH